MTRTNGDCLMIITVTICVVINSCQNEDHNICSPGEITSTAVGINLTTSMVDEECCCDVAVITSSSNPLISMFLEYDCTITITPVYNWMSGRTCNVTAKWENVNVDRKLSICITRQGPVTTSNLSTLAFKNRPAGGTQFNLTCNGSDFSTTQEVTSTTDSGSPDITTTDTTSTSATTTTTDTTSTYPATTSTDTTSTSATTTTDTTRRETTTKYTMADPALGTTRKHIQEQSKQLPVVAIVGIVLGVVVIIVIIAVVLFLLYRRRGKRLPLDDYSTRYQPEDLFKDEGNNESIIMRNNSLYVTSGADNSGYYQPSPVMRSASGPRVPKTQPFRGNVYPTDPTDSDSDAIGGGITVTSSETSPEEATFSY